jgi:hypothetical protein
MCEHCGMTHGRLHLDQVLDHAGPAILSARAVDTGVHSYRAVEVRPLSLYVVRVADHYEADRVSAYPSAEAAIAEAERVTTLPDSRGIMREWRVER